MDDLIAPFVTKISALFCCLWYWNPWLMYRICIDLTWRLAILNFEPNWNSKRPRQNFSLIGFSGQPTQIYLRFIYKRVTFRPVKVSFMCFSDNINWAKLSKNVPSTFLQRLCLLLDIKTCLFFIEDQPNPYTLRLLIFNSQFNLILKLWSIIFCKLLAEIELRIDDQNM